MKKIYFSNQKNNFGKDEVHLPEYKRFSKYGIIDKNDITRIIFSDYDAHDIFCILTDLFSLGKFKDEPIDKDLMIIISTENKYLFEILLTHIYRFRRYFDNVVVVGENTNEKSKDIFMNLSYQLI